MSDVVPAEALFRRLLGADRFDALPVPLRTLHLRAGRALWHGEVEVMRGTGALSRLCAGATRLPGAEHGPIEVETIAIAEREQGTPHIDAHVMP